MNSETNGKFSPVWPGPRLLVPLTLDILLVGNPDQQSTWAETRMNYWNLATGRIPDSPPPFQPKSTPPPTGAHLMWTLSYSLRHGQQTEDGTAVDFPLVPNRWLILRARYAAAGQPPQLTAGILQSDLLTQSDDPPSSYNQYPDFTDLDYPAKRIGQYVTLSDWAGPAGPETSFLKAVGPGTVSWAVVYDNVNNVFALHDPLSDNAGAYTYHIIGWYANPDDDLLVNMPTDTPSNWKTTLESKYQWSVGKTLQNVTQAQTAWQTWQKGHGLATEPFDPGNLDLPPQMIQAIETWHAWQQTHGQTGSKPDLPQQLLCHGMTATVMWQGSNIAYGTGAPGMGQKPPVIAVGNTATEAIATWLANLVVERFGGSEEDIPVIERATEAFQKGLLFELQPDVVGTEALLHKARFGSTFGGQEWIVVRPEDANETGGGEFGGQQTIPLDPTQTDSLTALNATQAESNAKQAELATQRWELFAAYYKKVNLGRHDPPDVKAAIEQALTVIKKAVQATLTELVELQQKITTQEGQLKTALGKDYVLKLVDLPNFYAPADPVVMVGGSQLDTKLAQPGTYDDDETLFTRFTGQTVTGMTIDYKLNGVSDPQLLAAADLLAQVSLPLGQAIPKEAPDLWVEMLFLDTSNAALLAQLYFTKRGVTPTPADLDTLTQAIQTKQTVIWNNKNTLGVDEQTLRTLSGLQGVIPAKVAVEFRTKQPWTPIFLDWKVKWFPTAMNPQDSLAAWQLGDIDYEWTEDTVPQPDTPLIFEGRTILNPKIAQDIGAKLATFISSDPNFQKLLAFLRNDLQHIADLIGKLDILTQSLSGFSEQLITRLMEMNQSPQDAEVVELLGDNRETFRPVTGPLPAVSMPFFPIRAGHFQVIDLWVVDSFGQILRGKDPESGPDSPILNLLRAESVTTSGATNDAFVQLPPRLTQPARGTFHLLQADNDLILSNSADRTSPICGWVMPNHLDDSLMVFDAAGNNLGEIIKVEKDVDASNPVNTGLRWDATPGTEVPLGALPQLPNDHLQRFVTALLKKGLLGGGVLDDLLNAIDSSLWQIDPLGAQAGNLSIMAGRPLAVVRGKVSLTLNGNPVYNQSWTDTGKYYVKNGQYQPTPPPFVSTPFSIRLGDLGYKKNGVLGYFAADDYDTFFSVYGTTGQTAVLRRSLKQGSRQTRAAMAAFTGEAETVISDYVVHNHLIDLPPDGTEKFITLLVDPRGAIPLITGILPVSYTTLAPGPVTQALRNMKINFRVGPILSDPSQVRMPVPAEIKGKWAWLARKDVTSWGPESDIKADNPIAKLEATPLRLSEGWLTLSGADDPAANK